VPLSTSCGLVFATVDNSQRQLGSCSLSHGGRREGGDQVVGVDAQPGLSVVAPSVKIRPLLMPIAITVLGYWGRRTADSRCWVGARTIGERGRLSHAERFGRCCPRAKRPKVRISPGPFAHSTIASTTFGHVRLYRAAR
jgi:hypothetical protein